MAQLDQIVEVNIDLRTSAIVVAGYSLPLFLGLHKGFTGRYKEYGSISAVATDFSTVSNEYKAATAFFSQNPSVNKIAIGRQDSTTVTYTPVITGVVAPYTVILNGTIFLYISAEDDTAADVVTGMITAINAGSEPVTASGTTTLVLTADVSGTAFTVKSTANMTPAYATSESLTDALIAVQNSSNAWYGITGYSHVKADQIEMGAFALATAKFYATSSSDVNIIDKTLEEDTTSIAVAEKDLGNTRHTVMYSGSDTLYPECALLGGRFVPDAGKETFKFKQLQGIPVDNLDDNQVANAQAKNCNFYIEVAGNNIFAEGVTSEGTFCDIIRDTDIFKSRLQVSTFSQFVNNPKIAFTNNGIATIEGIIRSEVSKAISDGILADDTPVVISVPKSNEVPVNDRALRKLTGITVTARIAGAIHSTRFDVAITV
jgi:hypothetical protein